MRAASWNSSVTRPWSSSQRRHTGLANSARGCARLVQTERHVAEPGDAQRRGELLAHRAGEDAEVAQRGEEVASNLDAGAVGPRRRLAVQCELAEPRRDLVHVDSDAAPLPPTEQWPLGEGGEQLVVSARFEVVRLDETRAARAGAPSWLRSPAGQARRAEAAARVEARLRLAPATAWPGDSPRRCDPGSMPDPRSGPTPRPGAGHRRGGRRPSGCWR